MSLRHRRCVLELQLRSQHASDLVLPHLEESTGRDASLDAVGSSMSLPMWIPRLATVLGSIDGAQFRARVDCAVVSGGKCHHFGFLEAAQCRPRSAPIFASEHPVAECPAVSNAVPVRIDGNALDLKFIQTNFAPPIFLGTCNDRQATRSSKIKSGSHFSQASSQRLECSRVQAARHSHRLAPSAREALLL
jgi:hypothetical protein